MPDSHKNGADDAEKQQDGDSLLQAHLINGRRVRSSQPDRAAEARP